MYLFDFLLSFTDWNIQLVATRLHIHKSLAKVKLIYILTTRTLNTIITPSHLFSSVSSSLKDSLQKKTNSDWFTEIFCVLCSVSNQTTELVCFFRCENMHLCMKVGSSGGTGALSCYLFYLVARWTQTLTGHWLGPGCESSLKCSSVCYCYSLNKHQ